MKYNLFVPLSSRQVVNPAYAVPGERERAQPRNYEFHRSKWVQMNYNINKNAYFITHSHVKIFIISV